MDRGVIPPGSIQDIVTDRIALPLGIVIPLAQVKIGVLVIGIIQRTTVMTPITVPCIDRYPLVVLDSILGVLTKCAAFQLGILSR